MFNNDPDKIIRTIAKNTKSLNLFTMAKDLGSVRLFNNISDFSHIQHKFISYLYFYTSLFEDLAEKKILKNIFNSEVYEDAYYLFKREGKAKTTEKPHSFYGVIAKDIKIKFPEAKKEIKP